MTVSRQEIRKLIERLCQAQQRATDNILENAALDKLGSETPDGFTVNDTLRMWVWHYWSHHRDIVLARGRLTHDNPHFHVPHYVRQANEEFGRFVGELACLTDEQLDLRVPGHDGVPEGRSIREIAEHTLATLESYFAEQIRCVKPREKEHETENESQTT
jgi:hypothetical protein